MNYFASAGPDILEKADIAGERRAIVDCRACQGVAGKASGAMLFELCLDQ